MACRSGQRVLFAEVNVVVSPVAQMLLTFHDQIVFETLIMADYSTEAMLEENRKRESCTQGLDVIV